MALKDWKKITKQPKSKSWVHTEYTNGKIGILVYEDGSLPDNMSWVTAIVEGDDDFEYHYFGTRPEALNDAKKYMRTH